MLGLTILILGVKVSGQLRRRSTCSSLLARQALQELGLELLHALGDGIG
jgi:hypothetical protein